MLDRLTGKILHIDFGDCFEVKFYRLLLVISQETRVIAVFKSLIMNVFQTLANCDLMTLY